MLKIKMSIRVVFTWIVQFSFRSFVDSVCSALLMCLFALQCIYYLRLGAGNKRINVINAFITYLSRDPRTEPNRAESPQLSRAGPRVPNRTKTSRSQEAKITRAKPRDKPSPADLAELRVQPEPLVCLFIRVLGLVGDKGPLCAHNCSLLYVVFIRFQVYVVNEVREGWGNCYGLDGVVYGVIERSKSPRVLCLG